jgi:DNA-binding response OmpR family regulator
MDEERSAALSAGMDAFIEKPIEMAALVSTIGRLDRRAGAPAKFSGARSSAYRTGTFRPRIVSTTAPVQRGAGSSPRKATSRRLSRRVGKRQKGAFPAVRAGSR